MTAPAGFNFRMLRLARDLTGATQEHIRERTGISQAYLSRFETGSATPSSEDLVRLSDVFALPVDFFLEPGTPAAVPMYRKRAIRSVRQLRSLQARLNTAVLVAQRLLVAGVDIEAPRVFPEPGDFDPTAPAEAAAALRRDWRLPVGPVDNMTATIEAAGGIVLRVDLKNDAATAAFLHTPSDGRLWFIVNTREDAGDRVRLSLAHELGHAVLHRMLPGLDEAQSEDQAFSFAAAFLLPPEHFDRSVPFDQLTLTGARDLKRVYGVSIQAIARAAYGRGRISRARYTSLYKQISARQWRTREPDPIPLERVHTWPEVLRVHREVHGYTTGELARIACVSESTLADLFPEDFEIRPVLRSVEPPRVRSA